MSNIGTAKFYLQRFSEKDLDSISSVLSENVVLRDWNVDVVGKQDVLETMHGIFTGLGTLSIAIFNIYETDNTVVVEMQLSIGTGALTELLIVDIIEFDDFGKISEIRAYLGNDLN